LKKKYFVAKVVVVVVKGCCTYLSESFKKNIEGKKKTSYFSLFLSFTKKRKNNFKKKTKKEILAMSLFF
jgi:hypothetical protein